MTTITPKNAVDAAALAIYDDAYAAALKAAYAAAQTTHDAVLKAALKAAFDAYYAAVHT